MRLDKKIFFLFCLFFLFLNSKLLYSLEVLYVQSEEAKVFDKPSFEGKIIIKLQKGTKIDVIEKKSSWIKTVVQGKEGYISSFVLAKNPPSEKITQKKMEIVETSRKRTSEYTTAVAGVRGLTEEDRKRLSIEGKVNYEALEKIENVKVTKEDIKKFFEEGGR